MTLTVDSRLCVYCSNLPQGFSTSMVCWVWSIIAFLSTHSADVVTIRVSSESHNFSWQSSPRIQSSSAVKHVSFLHHASFPEHGQAPNNAVSMDNRSRSHNGIPDYRSFSYLGAFKENTAFYHRSLAHRASLTQGSTTSDRGPSPYLTCSRYGHGGQQADVFGEVRRLVNA